MALNKAEDFLISSRLTDFARAFAHNHPDAPRHEIVEATAAEARYLAKLARDRGLNQEAREIYEFSQKLDAEAKAEKKKAR